MRRGLFTLLAFVLTSIVSAQTDTIPLRQYRILSTPLSSGPILSDSTDLYGRAYTPYSVLEKLPFLPMDMPQLQPATSGDNGQIVLEEKALHRIQAALLTTQYEIVTLNISCTSPYRITLDGYEMGRREYIDEMATTQSHDLWIGPSASHTLSISLVSDSKDTLGVVLVPRLADKSTLQLRTDATEYMSMEFTQSGRQITGVRVSPSGRYTILSLCDTAADQPSYSAVLYRGGIPISTLTGELLSARWMPSEDRLLIDKNTISGRSLITYDPETLIPSTLYPSIPEGSYTLAPNGHTLILNQTTKGPDKRSTLERVLGRDDHRNITSPRDHSFLYSFDLRTGDFRPLTYGFRSTYLRDISPDSRELIYSVSSEVTESPFTVSDYLTIDLTTMEIDTLFAGDPNIGSVLYTSRPDYLLVSGNADAFGGIGRNLPEGMIANSYDTQLFLYNRRTGQAKPLTKNFAPSVSTIRTSPNKFEAIFKAEARDYVRLYSIDLQSGRIKEIPTREENIGSFSTSTDLTHLAYEGESINNSERFYIGDKCTYDLAAERLKNIRLGTASTWEYTKADGQKVPGRYYLPPDFSADKKYPLLVYYYGGTSPSSRMFSWYYSAPMYAGQGYVVLVLNPSGTTGWGQEYAARHVNAWGNPTADDIISAVKGFCSEMSYVDASKIGCFGASYGGFMTQYLLTQTDLFAAAMSHAGISALSSYWGQGTWGIGYSTVASAHSYPWNNPDLYTKQSPLFNADKINTPLLLLHGTDDTNVPYGESVQMYNALKILGKEVELVRVYGQDHHIVDPAKQREWMQTTMAWFQKWLKNDPTWWNTLYPTVQLN